MLHRSGVFDSWKAHIDADNVASRRLAEKSGFVEVGTVDDESWAGMISIRVLYVRYLGS
jgi:RimJ/RimL family protein N-acetyltransferase